MEIINKNLFVAEKILALYEEHRSESRGRQSNGNVLPISPDAFNPLPLGDLYYALARLAIRNCFVFENGDEYVRYPNRIKWDLMIKLKNLKRFIALAHDGTFGIKTIGDKKIVITLIDRLLRWNELDLEGKSRESDEVKWMEWIEDYSGAVKVTRKLAFGLQGSKNFEPAIEAKITDANEINRLRNNIKSSISVGREMERRADIASSQLPMRWYCVRCRGSLDVLSTQKDILAWLYNFKVEEYPKCRRDRDFENFFVISRSGKLNFKIRSRNGVG